MPLPHPTSSKDLIPKWVIFVRIRGDYEFCESVEGRDYRVVLPRRYVAAYHVFPQRWRDSLRLFEETQHVGNLSRGGR